MRWSPFVLGLALVSRTTAQPLVDLGTVNHLQSRDIQRSEISASIPLRLDTTGRLLLIDPYGTQWKIRTAGERYAPERDGMVEETMRGVGGAIAYVTPVGARWKLSVAGILRYHWLEEQQHGDIQPGGVLLGSRLFRPTLTLRAGVYVNHDAFGVFVRPLLGIDWRINDRTNLYGVLPASLTYERRIGERFRAGASFRSYNTSYGVRGGDYRRINETPVGLYLDTYLPGQVVLRVETGWCFTRKVFGGPGDPLYSNEETHYKQYTDHAIADAPYVRLVLAYRLRLDGT